MVTFLFAVLFWVGLGVWVAATVLVFHVPTQIRVHEWLIRRADRRADDDGG